MYNTNYRVMDKEGKVVFVNTSTACFSEFNSASNANLDYHKGYKMEIFYPMETMSNRLELNAWWLAQLLKWNMKFDFETRKIDFEKDTNYSNSMKSHQATRTEYAVWTIDYDNYNSKAHIKLALHLMRYIYEESMYFVLEDMKKVLAENPDEDPWAMFQYASSTCKNTGSGHLMFYGGTALYLKPEKVLFDIIERYAKEQYSQSSVSWLSNSCMCTANNSYNLNIELRRASLQKYKELIKTLK